MDRPTTSSRFSAHRMNTTMPYGDESHLRQRDGPVLM